MYLVDNFKQHQFQATLNTEIKIYPGDLVSPTPSLLVPFSSSHSCDLSTWRQTNHKQSQDYSLTVYQTQEKVIFPFPVVGPKSRPSSIWSHGGQRIRDSQEYVIWPSGSHTCISGRGVWVASDPPRASGITVQALQESAAVSTPQWAEVQDSICYPPPRTQLLTLISHLC